MAISDIALHFALHYVRGREVFLLGSLQGQESTGREGRSKRQGGGVARKQDIKEQESGRSQ